MQLGHGLEAGQRRPGAQQVLGMGAVGDGDGIQPGVRRELQVVRRVAGQDEAEILGELHLRVPGRHNLQNALATVSVGLELGLPFERVTSALGEFLGAERRFQLLGEVDGVMVVDDYGHHPTEIEAVLAAARAGLDRRLLVVFQPHRYTRTARLLEEFGRALSTADEVVLTDIYAAGEEAIPGVTVEAVADAVRHVSGTPVHVVRPLETLPGVVADLARPGDMVITLGAGSIGSVGERILAELGVRSRSKETTS